MTTLANAISTVRRTQPLLVVGSVAALRGMSVLVESFPAPVGSIVSIHSGHGDQNIIPGEVVGFTREHAVIMLLPFSHQ